jgi:hypothetical protein
MVKADPIKFGIDCTKTLLDSVKIDLWHSTHIHRLKADAEAQHGPSRGDTAFNPLNVSTADADTLVISNATILTMDSGTAEGDLIPEGTMIVKGGIIQEVLDQHLLGARDVAERVKTYIKRGASVLDAEGGT